MSMEAMNLCIRMVNEDFAPLIEALEKRHKKRRAEATIQVHEDLGIRKLVLKKESLQAQVDTITRALAKYHEYRYDEKRQRSSTMMSIAIDDLIDSKDTALQRVLEERNAIFRKIKLSIIGADVLNVFETLPSLIAYLKREYLDEKLKPKKTRKKTKQL